MTQSDRMPLPLRFDVDGLVPVVIQDAGRGDVLMVGFMNDEALAATRATGRVHFWSRSRNRLWRKGETSGHEQAVDQISVNCEQNSLLIKVHQIGAVCHDGYSTCYYRRLESDNRLTITQERAFDPVVVYPGEAQADLAQLTRDLMATYALLRDHDLSAASATSRSLRAAEDTVTPRIADELSELAGVLNGTHRHGDIVEDVRLEATQVLYWVLLATLRTGNDWTTLRPDRALTTPDSALQRGTVAELLQADAESWRTATFTGAELAARCHATLALVAQACVAVAIEPREIVAADLRDLSSSPYLATLLDRRSAAAVEALPNKAEDAHQHTTDLGRDRGEAVWR